MTCNNCTTENIFQHSRPSCYYSGLELSVVQCTSCELVYLSPRPDKNLGLQYFENAYSNAKGFESNSYYRDHNSIFKRNNARFETITNIDSPNKKILDFGAGQGHFVKTAQDKGWECSGIEISEAGRVSAKDNLQLDLLESIEDLTINDFGVIALWDVIEHLENPKETLEQLAKYLHPEGFFIIETSNIDSIEYLASPKKWSYWHIDHLYYYSKKSLNNLFHTMNYSNVKLIKSDFSQKKTFNEKLNKYLTLLKPKNAIMLLKYKYTNTKHKGLDKGSLMIEVYKRSN